MYSARVCPTLASCCVACTGTAGHDFRPRDPFPGATRGTWRGAYRQRRQRAWMPPSSSRCCRAAAGARGSADVRARRRARRCSTSCLELAEEVGTIDAVALPGIPTGLFVFPGDVAARIALRAVDAWLAAHPHSRIRIIFTPFQAVDGEHYINALQDVGGSRVSAPTKLPSLLPGDGVQAIRDADAIMIRVGHGADYTDETLFAELYPGLLKPTCFRCLYDTIRTHRSNLGQDARILGPPRPAQSKRDHFVVTSNADRLFFQSGFDPARIYTPQGGEGDADICVASVGTLAEMAYWGGQNTLMNGKRALRIVLPNILLAIPELQRAGCLLVTSAVGV
ncbi:putative ganglioside induced differentiation associated protein [Mycena kentingensis (nom. inval.)]|nr:putative ganglioside induced differentiation associated protein [Mycena kentingensis (nom. inval.)]